ncbi:hypothetical protein AL062_24525 [Pseudomonas syringae pv. syringae]|nr:hypothetical protein AL062_24525 [Pseudomonas syringae pv. syringae]
MDPIDITDITMPVQQQSHVELSLGLRLDGLAVIKIRMAKKVGTVSKSLVAASTLAAKVRLPLCEDPCLIPACRYSLLIVCWSESQAR